MACCVYTGNTCLYAFIPIYIYPYLHLHSYVYHVLYRDTQYACSLCLYHYISLLSRLPHRVALRLQRDPHLRDKVRASCHLADTVGRKVQN